MWANVGLKSFWWQHRSLSAACFGAIHPKWSLPFWDCGGLQALVAVQSGEFQIVHGIGAAEGFRGGPWEFRDGLLHGSAATVDPKHQFDWDVALGDDMALSLEHRHSEVNIPCSVAQNMFEGKVLNLSLPHGAGSSSSGTALSLFETEVYWSTAPTAFADGEPISLWVPLTHVVAFLYPACSDLKRKCGNTYEAWKRMMQTCGLATDHLQRSKRSADARAKDADGFEPFSLDEGAAMDWRTTAPGFTLLLTCLSVSGRYHDDDGDQIERVPYCTGGWITCCAQMWSAMLSAGPTLPCPLSTAKSFWTSCWPIRKQRAYHRDQGPYYP